MVQVNVGGVPKVAMIVDSGASCSVIDRKLWEELKQNKVKCVSMKSNKKLYPYGSAEPLKTAGFFVATVTVRNVTVEVKFTVIEGKGQALLRRKTATKLNVLCLGEEVRVNALKQEDIFDKYKSCFEGLGKLKDFQLDIPIDQGPVPERRNNSIPGINVSYFRDNFIPGINYVPERRNNAIKGINLG